MDIITLYTWLPRPIEQNPVDIDSEFAICLLQNKSAHFRALKKEKKKTDTKTSNAKEKQEKKGNKRKKMNEAFCNASYMAEQTTFYTTTHTSWLKEVFIFVFALSLYMSLCFD